MGWKYVLWVAMAGPLAVAQELPKESPPELPVSCDVHACLLDPDRDPCDPEEIRLQLVFMREGEDLPVVYALDRGASSDSPEPALFWNVHDLEGTHFKMGVSVRSSYPTGAQGEKARPRREFLSPFKSPFVPEAEQTREMMDRGGKGVYFKVRLEAKDIRAMAAKPGTQVYLILLLRGERKAIQCFSGPKATAGEKS